MPDVVERADVRVVQAGRRAPRARSGASGDLGDLRGQYLDRDAVEARVAGP